MRRSRSLHKSEATCEHTGLQRRASLASRAVDLIRRGTEAIHKPRSSPPSQTAVFPAAVHGLYRNSSRRGRLQNASSRQSERTEATEPGRKGESMHQGHSWSRQSRGRMCLSGSQKEPRHLSRSSSYSPRLYAGKMPERATGRAIVRNSVTDPAIPTSPIFSSPESSAKTPEASLSDLGELTKAYHRRTSPIIIMPLQIRKKLNQAPVQTGARFGPDPHIEWSKNDPLTNAVAPHTEPMDYRSTWGPEESRQFSRVAIEMEAGHLPNVRNRYTSRSEDTKAERTSCLIDEFIDFLRQGGGIRKR